MLSKLSELNMQLDVAIQSMDSCKIDDLLKEIDRELEPIEAAWTYRKYEFKPVSS